MTKERYVFSPPPQFGSHVQYGKADSMFIPDCIPSPSRPMSCHRVPETQKVGQKEKTNLACWYLNSCIKCV